jgi:uncharacterized SAM-binding protein YcdF (DUF218 family)
MSWLSYSSLIPPNVFILLAAISLILAWRSKRFARVLATAAIGCLYLVSTPVVAYLLLQSTEAIACIIPVLHSDAPPGAIVVLAADARHSGTAGELGTVGPLTLERLAEAAREQRRLGLPILVSGGPPTSQGPSVAALMSKALEDDFALSVQWREERSQNTFENASFSAAILRQAGIQSALIVAHPWDMPRALWSFWKVGYAVIPTPTPNGGALSLSLAAFLPQVPALQGSYCALHELIGLAWYRLRYGDW